MNMVASITGAALLFLSLLPSGFAQSKPTARGVSDALLVGNWRFDVDGFPSPWEKGKTVGDELRKSSHNATEVKAMNDFLASFRAASLVLKKDHTYISTFAKKGRRAG